MNILVLCDHSQTRSVAMASLLREQGHFAVAGSYDNWISSLNENLLNSKHIRELRRVWSMVGSGDYDKIIFMQEGGEHFIGRDEWGSWDNVELREKCLELAGKLKLLKPHLQAKWKSNNALNEIIKANRK